MMRTTFAAAALLLALPAAARPQDHAHPTAERLGIVHFETSCRPQVAPRFDRAIALLHSFEFGDALKGFGEVLAQDPACAMAQWGIALSRWGNPMAAGNKPVAQLRLGREAAEAGASLAAGATERERGYIAAVGQLFDRFEQQDQRTRLLAYERAMGELAARHPTDTEARIFHAISLAAAASPTDKTYANQLRAGAVLESLVERQPEHPGLSHYIIHSYDYPALAGKARAAAKRYAAIAPSAAHALHMPSHTFTRVGMWEESVRTNMRSMEVALANGSISEALHAADYAVYAHLQLGQEAEARALLDRLPALDARFDVNAVTGAAPGSAGVFALAAIPARWALERRAWAEAAALEPKASAFPYTEAMSWLTRGLGASHTGDLVRVRAAVDSLAAIQRRLATAGEAYWAEQVAIQHLAAQAWLAHSEGRPDDALTRMREAAVREDATEKNAVTPGPLVPARELLGDLLLALGRPDEARAEYARARAGSAVRESRPGRHRRARRDSLPPLMASP
jgi:hypothetical protein